VTKALKISSQLSALSPNHARPTEDEQSIPEALRQKLMADG